jgi:hypothetical protein
MSVAGNSTVTVAVTKDVDPRNGATQGTFTLNRTGDASQPLSVNYSLLGTAAVDVDYAVSQQGQQASTINFAAGSSSTTVTVTPVASTNIAQPQSIVMSLTSGVNYSVGVPATATMALAGNTVPVSSMQIASGAPAFNWASQANTTYRILYKNDLNAPAWIAAGPDITATGATASWTDTNTADTTQRFYVLIQVQ